MKLKDSILSAFLIVSVFTLNFTAQEVVNKKERKKAEKLEREKIEKLLDAFKVEKCDYSNAKLNILRIDRMAKNKKDQNLVRDTADGMKGVSRTDGYRLMFVQEIDRYLFSNFRIDRSRPESYENDKKIVLEHLEKIIRETKEMETSKPLETKYGNFISYYSNRKDIIGDTIGITILFDDKNFIIMTAYFINMPEKVKPEFKLFDNIQEWKIVRDRFLNSYTKCLNENIDNFQTR